MLGAVGGREDAPSWRNWVAPSDDEGIGISMPPDDVGVVPIAAWSCICKERWYDVMLKFPAPLVDGVDVGGTPPPRPALKRAAITAGLDVAGIDDVGGMDDAGIMPTSVGCRGGKLESGGGGCDDDEGGFGKSLGKGGAPERACASRYFSYADG